MTPHLNRLDETVQMGGGGGGGHNICFHAELTKIIPRTWIFAHQSLAVNSIWHHFLYSNEIIQRFTGLRVLQQL